MTHQWVPTYSLGTTAFVLENPSFHAPESMQSYLHTTLLNIHAFQSLGMGKKLILPCGNHKGRRIDWQDSSIALLLPWTHVCVNGHTVISRITQFFLTDLGTRKKMKKLHLHILLPPSHHPSNYPSILLSQNPTPLIPPL